MIALDTLLDDPKLALRNYLTECLTGCIDCQYRMHEFGQLGKNIDGREDVVWPMLCVTHSPWIRAKQDPTYIPSIRREIAILTTKLTTASDIPAIGERMENGRDMLKRQKIDQNRFETRMAELEEMLRVRVEMEDDLAYWKSILKYAATDDFQIDE